MANAIISDSYDVTTLLGSHLALSTLLPVNFDTKREFTLNTHFNIFPSEAFTTRPLLRYFGVGIGGCYNADDGILSSAYNPARTNMNLFNLIPIRCVPVDEDLSDAERASYRLRQRKTINGNEYFIYYLKVLEFADEIKFKTIDTSTGTEEEYDLSAENLSPTPIKPSADTTVKTNTGSVVAYCDAKVEVDASEVLEYINIAYNGDTRYARISEIGFFTGVDKVVTGATAQNAALSYTEAIYTQLYNHSTWTGTPLTHVGMKISTNFQITSPVSLISA